MHELGVVFHLIDAVQEQARQNNLESIESVEIELGEVSGIVEEMLLDCWKWAVSKQDNMKNCSLHIHKIEALTYCPLCNSYYKTVKFGRVCPVCGSLETYLFCDNEFILSSMTAM